MKKLITITDVTRMQQGRVCIAGYDQQGNCIRPVLPPPGIMERSLYSGGSPIVFPFAVVEYELTVPDPKPPHTEDYRYKPGSTRLIKRLTDEERRAILTNTIFKSVSEIFEQPIQTDPGFYVVEGQGPRSIGTIQPLRIIKVVNEQSSENKPKYRIGFVDRKKSTFWLTVTDLGWRYFIDWQIREGSNFSETSSRLTGILKGSEVYLRVGLARGWEKFPERCFLQVTGIYTFPDYLEGRTFADFASDFEN